jgi:glycosyltransferase involved in cell wall biosynthesis
MRLLLFTDTLGDVNGVSRFIRNTAEEARRTGRDLRVLTSTNFDVPAHDNLLNFPPLAAMKMPKYEHLELALPPALAMLSYARTHRPDAIHISTPGPVGCMGLLAAKLLRVPALGVYHTDFPAYVDHLFNHESMTFFTKGFMRRFYSRFAAIFTRSEGYMQSLTALGIPHARLVHLRPGIITDHFHPRFKDPTIWPRYGSPKNPIRVLSVGRISVEKNMPLLAQAWKRAGSRLRQAGIDAEFIVVGDGPYRRDMEQELGSHRTRFLGFRHGEELSSLYASADLFVFPSTTDTLGQVAMEAQASGLPVIVSDTGGPKEVMQPGRTGLVIRAGQVEPLAEAIVHLASDANTRTTMGAAAHTFMQQFSMKHSFEHFWQVHAEATQQSLAAERRPSIAPSVGSGVVSGGIPSAAEQSAR